MESNAIMISSTARAALRRAGVSADTLVERHRNGDTGNGMGWELARIQTRNALDGQPWFSHFQLTRTIAVRVRTGSDGTTSVYATSTSPVCNCRKHRLERCAEYSK